jgi:hypothetical protein
VKASGAAPSCSGRNSQNEDGAADPRLAASHVAIRFHRNGFSQFLPVFFQKTIIPHGRTTFL